MVRFGVIGTSKITEEFIKSCEKIDTCTITSLLSRTRKKGEEFASRHGIEKVFTTLEEMAENNSIDAVYIASPNFAHAEQAVFFLKRGIPVLCEKPLATSLEDFDKMVKAAKDNQTLLMEAMKSTLVPNFNIIKENLYKIEPVRGFFGNFSQYSSRYDLLKSGERTNIFNEFHGGSVLDIGIYPLEFALAMFGFPKNFSGSSLKLNYSVDISGNIILNYKDMVATLIHSKSFNSYIPSEIQGEKGTIVIHKLSTVEKVSIHYNDGSVENISISQDKDSMVYEIHEFLSLMERGEIESKINTHELSRKALEIMLAVR